MGCKLVNKLRQLSILFIGSDISQPLHINLHCMYMTTVFRPKQMLTSHPLPLTLLVSLFVQC
jgi:hypothetical protein